MVEGGTLSQDDFAEWGKEYVLFCHITTQVKEDKHQDLLGKKGGRGFPHIVMMNSAGAVLAVHEGSRDVSGFTQTATVAKGTAAELEGLDKKVAAGDKAAQLELFELQMELGHLSLDEARAHMAKLTLDDAQKKKFNGMIANLEVDSILATVTRDKATRIAAGAKFAAMLAKGVVPAGEGQKEGYWILLLDHAEDVKDAGLFEKGLGSISEFLKGKYGDHPGVKQFLEGKQEILEGLKKG